MLAKCVRNTELCNKAESGIIDNTLKNQLLETKGLFWGKMNFFLDTSYEYEYNTPLTIINKKFNKTARSTNEYRVMVGQF